MKNIAVLGITGSIGTSAVEIIRQHGREFVIMIASCHSQYKALFQYVQEFSIPIAVITDLRLREQVKDIPEGLKLYWGESELCRLLKSADYDIALNAVTGSAGLPYTMAVIETGKALALANKESLVMAGELVYSKQRQTNSPILPVDSEHSAVFQVLHGHTQEEIRTILLTASGGPFRTLPLDKFAEIKLEQALNHPTWDMGVKVTIDSATMFNKGLEVIEAHWLFGVSFEQVRAYIHPQSIIHSMVEFVDGSIHAQMSVPSMQLPILYAFSYPKHIPSNNVKTHLIDLPALTFDRIEKERYPLFFLACEAGKQGGIMPTVMNAANEAAIQLFVKEKIAFNEIFRIIDEQLQRVEFIAHPDLATILYYNHAVYANVIEAYSK